MLETQQKRIFALMCLVSLTFGAMTFIVSPILGLTVAALPFIFIYAPRGIVATAYWIARRKELKKTIILDKAKLAKAGFASVSEKDGIYEIKDENREFSSFVKIDASGKIAECHSESRMHKGKAQPRTAGGIFSLFRDLLYGFAQEEAFLQETLLKIRECAS